MKIGIIDYQIAYSSEKKKVCISSPDIQPASVHWYTRAELVELIALNNAHKELYEMALESFPAASVRSDDQP